VLQIALGLDDDEASDCSAGVTRNTVLLFVISHRIHTGDFVHRLSFERIAAADYMQAVAQVVGAFEEAVVRRTTPNGFVVVWWRVGLCLCRELGAAEWPRKRS
jgi:hypothetical protein